MNTENKHIKARPPVVVVMGHVDHGKTTLLDYIRKTSYVARAASDGGEPRSVAEREAGGITQSIGAYEIWHTPAQNVAKLTPTGAERIPRGSASGQRESAEGNFAAGGRKITFIDTPGHEAFMKMRSRGANIADLAILVVAADEGIKPQTQESIKILNEAKTPFVVAITKIDKPNADVARVKNDLANVGVFLEGYGGQTSYQPVSSKTGEGINELLDLILLAAEVEHLTYDESVPAEGYVLEAKLDRQRGFEASLIVKNGVMKQGDFIKTPTAAGKAKILEDFLGKPQKSLAPSSPALVIGLENLPQAGETFSVTEKPESGAQTQTSTKTPTQTAADDGATLKLILKSSDAGSLEALSEIVKAMAKEKPIRILSESVGEVNDNDVKLAIPSNAVIIAFKSKTDKASKNLAEANNIRIISSEIIYELLKAIEEFLNQLAKPKPAGTLKVLAVFNQDNTQKQIVGGKVETGVFRNKASFEIERNGAVVGVGRTLNLQQQKKDAPEVSEGKEAGLMVSSDMVLKVGDALLARTESK